VSIAPWALGFADSAVPTWTHVVIGHVTLQVETDPANDCALAPDEVV
jgi:hypothetical protein